MTSSRHPPLLAGWYGKLPSLGDFASRRLAPDFIEAWDDWLANGLLAWQGWSPDTWLEGYLAGPTWRFVLMPGALGGPCGETAWAGILMPSVDRVGRYFPFTAARPFAQLPTDEAQVEALLGWLRTLSDAAVSALHDDWSIEQLELALDSCTAPQLAAPGAAVIDWTASSTELRPPMGVGGFLAGQASAGLQARLQGRSLWLHDDEHGQPRLRAHTGLPRGGEFAALISGADAASPLQPTASDHEQ